MIQVLAHLFTEMQKIWFSLKLHLRFGVFWWVIFSEVTFAAWCRPLGDFLRSHLCGLMSSAGWFSLKSLLVPSTRCFLWSNFLGLTSCPRCLSRCQLWRLYACLVRASEVGSTEKEWRTSWYGRCLTVYRRKVFFSVFFWLTSSDAGDSMPGTNLGTMSAH